MSRTVNSIWGTELIKKAAGNVDIPFGDITEIADYHAEETSRATRKGIWQGFVLTMIGVMVGDIIAHFLYKRDK